MEINIPEKSRRAWDEFFAECLEDMKHMKKANEPSAPVRVYSGKCVRFSPCAVLTSTEMTGEGKMTMSFKSNLTYTSYEFTHCGTDFDMPTPRYGFAHQVQCPACGLMLWTDEA